MFFSVPWHSMRIEKDIAGEMQVPDTMLYGIHALRAQNNFPCVKQFHIEWYKAMGVVKYAMFETCKDYKKAAVSKLGKDAPINLPEDTVLKTMSQVANEISNGEYFDAFIVPAVSGGAGTSINMNINEIIANRSLQLIGEKPGNYSAIDPFEDANIYQSTNDVVPTALKVAVMKQLVELEDSINALRKNIEQLERKYASVLRIGYTQMQEAVPTTYGRLFGTFNEALSRDWWRVSKCFERIKVVNLGGGAIGTGLTIPKYIVMEVARKLQHITGLPLTRAENLSDATSNIDAFVEVHAIVKTHAVNLEKIVADIRLLSSDISSDILTIPNVQTGSSIMPGKVNPVIAEYIISSAHTIYANDQLISNLCAQGCLELNAYIPVIGHALIESLQLLIACNKTLKDNLIDGLYIDKEKAQLKFIESPSITTALIPHIGYKKASELAIEMKQQNVDIYTANEKLKMLDKSKIEELLKPENLLQEGYRISDL